MMNLRRTLPLAVGLLAVAANAQPTLTAANTVPANGQEFPVQVATSNIGPGAAAANANYDYWSMLTAPTALRNYRWFDADVTPTGNLIPSSTLLSTDGGQDTIFWDVTANGMEQVGARLTLYQGAVNYSDPVLELKLPCTFGTTWTDTHAASYTLGGFPVTRTGTITGNADGYGTLRLPQGAVHSNVLRVHVRRVITDAAILATSVRRENTWYFYEEGARYPTLKVVTDSLQINNGAWSESQRAAEWMGQSFIVGVDDFNMDEVFTAYPNPANDLLVVEADGSGSVELLDAAGRVIERHRVQADRMTLGTGHLPAGLYQLRMVRATGDTVTRRFAVQH